MFKRKGVIKHKASALKFCSGITDLIPKYHPREESLGSGVVYIKVSLVKSKEGGGKGFVQHLAATPKSPGLRGGEGCVRL